MEVQKLDAGASGQAREGVALRDSASSVPGGERSLSSYAFNTYGNDAKLYNGIFDLETAAQAVTHAERVDLVELLGCLKDHLESAIESSLVPGTSRPLPGAAEHVEADRALWRKARDWIERLELSTATPAGEEPEP
jgi:hypothetical protein